ncbi:hypothetical protein PPN87_01660 [Proteus mirabilis]|uniref:hypothetical protein n=1 Tax=Proteus mirabilis TaxID=584 RepID=UPI002349A06F|nr:hypothetical protein [Proteus mirabilis]MDC5946177.1 hypothetical protein [Proteus mirabilis]
MSLMSLSSLASCFSGAKEDLVVSDSAPASRLPAETDTFLLSPCRATSPSVLSFKHSAVLMSLM